MFSSQRTYRKILEKSGENDNFFDRQKYPIYLEGKVIDEENRHIF